MAQRLALNIGIGATVNSSLGKSFEQAEKESADLGKSYEKINKQLGRAREVQKYESQLKKLNQRIASGKNDSLAMIAVKEKLEKQLKQSQRAAKNAGVDIRNLEREERTLAWRAKQAKKQQDQLNDSLRETALRAKQAEEEQERLNRELSKTSRMQKMRTAVSGRAMGYGQETMVGRGVTAMGGSAGLAGGLGLAAAGVGAVGIAAGAAGGAAFAAAVRVSEQMEAINKQAKQLGTTTTALQELQYVAKKTAGLESEDMYTALQDQAERISEAAMLGTGEAVDVLAALNLNAAELNKLSPDEQFMKIAEAMEKVENQNDRQQLSIKMWSDTGAKLVNTFAGGAEALQALRNEADIIPASAIKNAGQFNKAFVDLKGSVSTAFAMVMGPALPWFADRMEELRNWIRENRDGLGEFAGGVGQVFSLLFRLGGVIYKTVAPGFKLLWTLISPIVKVLGELMDMLVTVAEKALSFRDGFLGKIPGIGGLFGGDENTPETATATANTLPERKPVGGNTTNYTPSNSMVIQTQPGQDPEQIGNIVMQKMEERDRQQSRQFRGSMFDMTPGMI